MRAKNRNVVITGATGFIGSNLSRYLVKKGWNVHLILRTKQQDSNVLFDVMKKVNPHRYDGSTESIMQIIEKTKPELVFHLASLYLAQHRSHDITPLIQSNILLGTQLLEAMAANNIRNLVNAGTSWQHFQDEDYNPVCLYAATKQAFETILAYYVEVHSVRVVTLKLFDTYGPNDMRKKLFNFLGHAARGKEPIPMSPGNQRIDLVYIDDVVEAFAVAGKRLLDGRVKKSESYAISSGKPLTLRKIVNVYNKIAGIRLPITWGGIPYRKREVMVPWTKGRKLPGWTARVPLKEGIRKIIRGKTRTRDAS